MSLRLAHNKGVGRQPLPTLSANDVMRIPNHQSKNNNINNNNINRRQKLGLGEIPYVSHDGGKTRYYADRFYLDAPTSLLEYQLANNNNDNNVVGNGVVSTTTHDRNRIVSSSSPPIDYCNKCGEIRNNEQPPQHYRGTLKRPPKKEKEEPSRPLFDRSKFINSLDLSCAIIGTYTIGSFDMLSNEFPMLFPKKYDEDGRKMKSNVNTRHHVPTLVLHGQRGFNMERWSSSRSDEPKQKANENAAMDIRGGGGEESQQEVLESTTNPDGDVDMKQPPDTDTEAKKKKRKRPCFTYGNQQLKLPKTPKRLRTSKKKNGKKEDDKVRENVALAKEAGSDVVKESAHTNNAENNCRKGYEVNNDGDQTNKATGSRSAEIVIVIDSSDDSDQDEPNDTKKPAAKMALPTKAPPPQTPPPSSGQPTANLRMSPPINVQQPRKSMPLENGVPQPPNLSDMSDERVKKLPPPDASISVDTPPGGFPRQPMAASLLPESTVGKPKINDSKQQQQQMPPPKSAAQILTNVLGKPLPKTTMRPIFYNSGPDSSQDSNMSIPITRSSKNNNTKDKGNMGWGGVKPVSTFDGEVFFTQVLPRWRVPPSPREREDNMKRRGEDKKKKPQSSAAQYSDNEEEEEGEAKEMKTVRGVHHPKFFLLFERSGSLVVIISSANLTPQNSTEGTWVQRFYPQSPGSKPSNSNVDYGMPSDFGHVLSDFLDKQSEAAEGGRGTMLPDVFLRRYAGLASGLSSLSDQYRFNEAQVHLVSTVPGDYVSGLPKNSNRVDATYKPRITYGAQRVSFILSRILNEGHIKSAKVARAADSRSMDATMAWLHPTLKKASDRLVMQPTSLGGNWTRVDLEEIVKTYLQPHWNLPTDDEDVTADDSPLSLMDLVWPSMDYFESMKSRRRAIRKDHPELAMATAEDQCVSKEDKKRGFEAHCFLSSINFSNLNRSCLSRMALYTPLPKVMPYKSTSLHIKSICRLFQLKDKMSDSATLMTSSPTADPREYLSWFMLTSACLSRGAQGQPTPYTTDSMSYSNFELGVLFCSRLVGDNVNDRLYVSDPNHVVGCQCGKGKRMYKYWEGNDRLAANFLDSVKKVHLPVPFELRPTPYQQDPDSDYMSWTPYMHEDNSKGWGCEGNMKLTPLGQKIADDCS